MSAELAASLDELLRVYEDTFQMRRPLFISSLVGDQHQVEARFIGGAVESLQCSYLFETKANIRQSSKLPAGVQLQLPAGQAFPLIPGLPREYNIELTAQGWVRNKAPKGVTL